MKKFLIPIILVVSEISFTLLKNINNGTPLITANSLFVWGVIFFIISIALIFGADNRLHMSMYTKVDGSTYGQNAGNYLGTISKNFFTRVRDFNTGAIVLILSLINFLIYFFLIS